MDRSRNFAVFYMEWADVLTDGAISLRRLGLPADP
tara:strand:+ start:63916 stop:64020 length:105 start_codon:yes stop_codon:yes gene_type:complete